MATIKRKLYKRGSSVETTIPKPLLFALDENKKHNIIFNYDIKQNRWYVEFESAEEEEDNNISMNKNIDVNNKRKKRSKK